MSGLQADSLPWNGSPQSRTITDVEAARLHKRQWGRVGPSHTRYTGWYGSSKVKANIEDMSGYMRTLLSETNPMGRLFEARQLCQAEVEYDGGWQIIRGENGPCILRHGGNIWGANTAMVLVPELELGIAVLMNNEAGPSRCNITGPIKP